MLKLAPPHDIVAACETCNLTLTMLANEGYCGEGTLGLCRSSLSGHHAARRALPDASDAEAIAHAIRYRLRVRERPPQSLTVQA